jgi:hypothetical protein
MNRKNLTLIGTLFLIIAVPLTVIAVRIVQDIRSSADLSIVPREVIVSNLTSTSVTISWTTSDQVVGLVNYGNSADSLNNAATDNRDDDVSGRYNLHYVTINNLTPETQYLFEISSSNQIFDDNGTPYSFTTLPTSDDLSTPTSITGTLEGDVSSAIIYAHATLDGNISTTVSTRETDPNYALVKGTMRDPQTGEIFDVENANVVISAVNSDLQRGSVRMAGSKDNAPDIQLSSNSSLYDPAEIVNLTEDTSEPTNAPTQPPQTTVGPTPIVGGQVPIEIVQDEVIDDLITGVTYSVQPGIGSPTLPNNIFVSNISPNGFCVNWFTQEPATGRLEVTLNSDNLTIFDERDTSQSQTERYTHIACLSEPSLLPGDEVEFFIRVSDNARIGPEYQQNTPFTFVMPDIPDSPPSPGSVEGTITTDYPSSLSTNIQDTLVFARFEFPEGQSTWVSTTINEDTWSLPFADVIDEDLEDYFEPLGSDQFEAYARGQYNSSANQTIANQSDITDLVLDQGLSVTNLKTDTTLSQAPNLVGTAPANSEVTITVNTQDTIVNSNEVGLWQVNFGQLNEGLYSVLITSNSTDDDYPLSFTIDADGVSGGGNGGGSNGGGNLPDTGAQDWIPYIIGTVLITSGLILYANARRLKNS